jgi:hypothetical protein
MEANTLVVGGEALSELGLDCRGVLLDMEMRVNARADEGS